MQQLALSTGDEVEVRNYGRLTPLNILDKPLGKLTGGWGYERIRLDEQLALSTGDEVEVRNYGRLTPLNILDKPLGKLTGGWGYERIRLDKQLDKLTGVRVGMSFKEGVRDIDSHEIPYWSYGSWVLIIYSDTGMPLKYPITVNSTHFAVCFINLRFEVTQFSGIRLSFWNKWKAVSLYNIQEQNKKNEKTCIKITDNMEILVS